MNYTTAFPARVTPSRVTPTSVTPTRVAPRRTTLVLSTIAAVLAILNLFLSSCAGTRAREASVPVIAQAYESVRVDVQTGAALLGDQAQATILAADQAISDALKAGDLAKLATLPYDDVLNVAHAGIVSELLNKTVGPEVASSLYERVEQVRKTIKQVTAPR